jgi:hypothetical protein
MNERDIELAAEAEAYADQNSNCEPVLWGQAYDSKLIELIRADEREACAKICDFEWGTGAEKDAGIMFAAVIRARGNT